LKNLLKAEAKIIIITLLIFLIVSNYSSKENLVILMSIIGIFGGIAQWALLISNNATAISASFAIYSLIISFLVLRTQIHVPNEAYFNYDVGIALIMAIINIFAIKLQASEYAQENDTSTFKVIIIFLIQLSIILGVIIKTLLY